MDANAGLFNHYALKAGDYDPELNKTVDELVLNTESFVVYIDTEMGIQWHTTKEHRQPKHCGEVLNRIAALENRSRFIKDNEILKNIRRQIAEGLARCFSGQPLNNSISILNEVGLELQTRNKETSWSWYFSAAYNLTFWCIVAIALMWLSRNFSRNILGDDAFEVLLGTLCGAIGALLSVTSRGHRLTMDANAGMQVHKLEGLSRMGAGLGGAFLTALAIKGGIILGGTHFSGSRFAVLLAFCIVAGASERLVPSLIASFEQATFPAGKNKEKKNNNFRGKNSKDGTNE